MRTGIVIVAIGIIGAAGAGALAQQLTEDERRDLRTRIEERYDVVPLSDGIALRPKTRTRDVRLIEITDAIAINGVPVTGTELQQRIGDDAKLVLRLSYLDSADLLALFAPPAAPPEPTPPPVPEPEIEAPRAPQRPAVVRRQRSSGDRVRIFGDVAVPENDSVSGQVVAVMGSVRVDGEVGDQVVAVLGSVDLGPKAVVGGDVVSVGGRVRRSEGAIVRGGVTEVAFASPGVGVHVAPWWVDEWRWGAGPRFGGISRFAGSAFRLMLFALLACLVLLVARSAVEGSAQRVADNPVNATLVGLAGIVLIGPILFLTAIVLVLTVIGIPLLLLLPFVVLALVVIAFVGFSGTAYAVGQWARRRFGFGESPFLEVCLGVLVILLPLLVARLLGVAGWPLSPVAFVLLMSALAFEFLAWTMGFGAILTNAFTRWRVTRTARSPVPPPVMP